MPQGSPGSPTAFSIRLVVDNGSEHYELEVGEGSMDEQMKALVQWLMPRATDSSGASTKDARRAAPERAARSRRTSCHTVGTFFP